MGMALRRWRAWPAAAALLALLLLAGPAPAEVAVPPLAARVTDLTGTLTDTQRQALELQLAAFEQEKGAQLAVLLVPSTAPETIEQYAIRVADRWKLGREGVDDGLLLLVAKNDRTVRIEVGYGLEGAVPDAIANRVIEEIIVPRFAAGDFYGGIDAGLDRLQGVLEGEPLPPPKPPRGQRPGGQQPLIFIFIAFMVLSGLLRALLGRLPGAAATAAIVGVMAWLLIGPLLLALAVGVFAFVLGLGGIGGRGGYYGGLGGGIGGRRGGFGGGGFGGGGGGFGGGGASGRW